MLIIETQLGALYIFMLISRSDHLGLIDNVPSNFGTRITSIHPKGGCARAFRSIKIQFSTREGDPDG